MAYYQRSAVASMNADYSYSSYRGAQASPATMRPRSWSAAPSVKGTYGSYISPSYSKADSVVYDSRVEDYLLSSRVDDANIFSNAVLDDSYDTARRSRGRDQKLLRDATQAITSAKGKSTDNDVLYGRRRYPRRFGKPGLRKSRRPVFYPDPMLHRKGGDAGATTDVMASARPAPGSRQRVGSRLTGRQSPFDDDSLLSRPSNRPSLPPRAQSVGPPPSRNYVDNYPSLSPSRRSLPPVQSHLSESKLLGGPRVEAALTPTPAPDFHYSTPVHSGYDPLLLEYEPDSKPAARRRPRVLGTSLRGPGNYYQRLMRKRGKRHGRFGPYYDLESIEGSDLTGVLSDRDSLPDLDGTYDCDDSVVPSYHTDYSSSSPYYVDQDTEYVPFKPARPLQTKGLFELSPYGDDVDDGDVDDEFPSTSTSTAVTPYRPPSSHSFPSPTTDLKLSTYLPSSLSSALSGGSSSLPSLPYRSVVSYSPSAVDDSLAVAPLTPVSPSQQLLDSLVSSSVSRAKTALNDLAIPEYHGASLLLSVEGSGVGPDGKKIGFTYTPSPIPLFGRTSAIDSKILGLRPNAVLKPVDNFLAGYVERMNNLRAQLNDRLDKDRTRRHELGLSAIEPYRPPARASSYSSYTPYTQSHDYVPVKHLSTSRLERMPVTTFRGRLDDGRTHRVDVFSLGDLRPRISSSTARAITLPGPTATSAPVHLSTLDKINIKVSSGSYATPRESVAARRVQRGLRSAPPRAVSVPPRPANAYAYEVETSPPRDIYTAESTTTSTKAIFAPRPIIIYAAPRRVESRAKSVPPVVFAREPEKPRKEYGWRIYAERASRARSLSRAPSMPPRARSVPPAFYIPPPRVSLTSTYQGRRRRARSEYRPVRAVEYTIPQPLPTAGLFAHKMPRRFLTRAGIRTYFSSLRGYYQHGLYAKPRRDLDEPYRRGAFRTRVVATPAARATPPNPSIWYLALARLYAARSKPKPRPVSARVSLSDFPKVYVPPRKGAKPSARAKAAIIASKLEPDLLKRRRPKSEYAAAKYRAIRKEQQESIYGGTPGSSGLAASTPPLPKLSERKAIRTEDGFSKPKNIMSWQYRIESMMSPNDLVIAPSSLIRIREQVRDAQERMDRHRQLIDRYLPEGEGTDVAASVLRKMHEMEKRDAIASERSKKPAKIEEQEEAL